MVKRKKLTQISAYVSGIALLLLIIAGCAPFGREQTVHLDTEDSQVAVVAKMDQTASVYTFSFDSRMDPADDVKMYAPFLRYLEQTTGYRFKMLPMTPSDNIVEALGQARVDVAAIGTLSYLQAHQKYGIRVIAAGLTEQRNAEYRALIITAENSNLHSLQDLKGKTFAFGAETSTQGHLIPLIMLDNAGIKLADLAGYTFTGSHFNTANAVLSGRYAAGGIQDKLGRELAAKGLIRILAESENFPSSTISVSPALPEDVVEKIQAALLAFQPEGKDKASLYNWDQSEMPLGFVTTNDQAFEKVRTWAVRLGLLGGNLP